MTPTDHVSIPLQRRVGGRSAATYRPSTFLSRLLGISEGEAATILVAVVVPLVLTLGGLPPVLRTRSEPSPRAMLQTPGLSLRSASGTEAGPVAALTIPAVPAPAHKRADAASQGSTTSDAVGGEAMAGDAAPSPAPAPTRTRPMAPQVGELALFTRVPSPGTPDGIAVDGDGTVYVSTNNGAAQGERGPSRILVFRSDGETATSFTVTGQPDDHAFGVTGIALDGRGGIVALDAATGRVLHFDIASGRQSVVATLFDLPRCRTVIAMESGCEPGINDARPFPRGLAFDQAGNLFVTDSAQGVVWRIAPDAERPIPWSNATVFGSGNGPAAIAVEPGGSVLAVVSEAVDPATRGGGGVYRIPVHANGTSGSPALVAAFARGELPHGLALLSDDSLAVSLAGADAVVLLGAAGDPVRRISGSAGDVKLDTPANLTFAGATLLVTNLAPANKANWAVVAVGIS